MIERLYGTVVATTDRMITVMASGIGFGVQVADTTKFVPHATATVYTYVHWNQEKGQSLFGFADELSRHLFCLLIGCQKIGPALALALLRQREPNVIIQDILSGNVAGLSSCQGIGTKKAELIIYELKEKIGLLADVPGALSTAGAQLKHMQDALLSLSYSQQEATKAINYVAGLYKGESLPDLNVLLRKALAYLSAPRE
ncbi:MAG: holliday junction helicase RuvA [Candidatus Dependentiae bacterium]|nr:holliday junction helicase RuvA [Candidatus Dependentiae bacterium]